MAEVISRQGTIEPVQAGSYVEWGAVLAGAVIAAGFGFVLLTFGAGIGLSLISTYPGHSYGRAALSIAAFWALVVPIASFLIGGYITGRLRAPHEGADEAETEFRDGIHGALVWGIGILFGAVLTFFAAGATAQTGATFAASSDKSAIYVPAVDTLYAPVTLADASPAPAQAPTTQATRTPVPSSAATVRVAEDRDGAERVLAASVAQGRLGPADKSYLAAIVSQRTGLSTADAENRVELAFEQARNAADKARKAAVIGALVTATALLIGLAGAWYGAQRGGHHRDSNIPARFTWNWRPRPPGRPLATD
jgi:hypothetical protein